MRQNIYKLTFFFLLSLSSCISEIKFEEPQPSGDKDVNKFKNKFRGTYLCLGDSSMLTVDMDKITQKWNLVAKLPKAQFDTTEGIEKKDGHFYSKESEEPLTVKFFGDTVILTCNIDKTLFQVGDNQVLRYFKGVYFLNYKDSGSFWTVKTLNLDKGGILTINRIYGGEEEIQKIKEMTTVEEIIGEEGEVVEHKVKPTKKELKEILKSDLFEEGTQFQKLKK